MHVFGSRWKVRGGHFNGEAALDRRRVQEVPPSPATHASLRILEAKERVFRTFFYTETVFHAFRGAQTLFPCTVLASRHFLDPAFDKKGYGTRSQLRVGSPWSNCDDVAGVEGTSDYTSIGTIIPVYLGNPSAARSVFEGVFSTSCCSFGCASSFQECQAVHIVLQDVAGRFCSVLEDSPQYVRTFLGRLMHVVVYVTTY